MFVVPTFCLILYFLRYLIKVVRLIPNSMRDFHVTHTNLIKHKNMLQAGIILGILRFATMIFVLWFGQSNPLLLTFNDLFTFAFSLVFI